MIAKHAEINSAMTNLIQVDLILSASNKFDFPPVAENAYSSPMR